MKKVSVIGAGLAGSECAYQLAKRGITVDLYDSKPLIKSEAHKMDTLCELVCSNSLKSNDEGTASGLLKAELRILDSLLIRVADGLAVPAGNALAVDRYAFSEAVTRELLNNKNINVIQKLVSDFDSDAPCVIASGPLTLEGLSMSIINKLGDNLHFFDAAAPIISGVSIDEGNAFFASRYGKGGENDYINCPLNKDEYENFISELVDAEKAPQKDFEKKDIFEECMPIEVMAARGRDALRFGPLKPVGFIDPKTNKRPYAVIQLRRENTAGDAYNIVGFQTNLKFSEQKRVFGLVPALKSAEYLRYGVMHRNSYINAPECINSFFQCLKYPNVFIAGQLSGVEGYVESIASGLMCGINMTRVLSKKPCVSFPNTTIIGSLSNYLSLPNKNFQPMNANFGLLPPLMCEIRDKEMRKRQYFIRAVNDLEETMQNYLIY